MIQEAFCSKEISKLLKEKGFDIPVNYEYHYEITIPQFHRKKHNFNGNEYRNCSSEWYSASTHQMVMAWLREVHNLCIGIYYLYPCGYEIEICRIGKDTHISEFEDIREYAYNTYEEAVEVAIKYCLENLI